METVRNMKRQKRRVLSQESPHVDNLILSTPSRKMFWYKYILKDNDDESLRAITALIIVVIIIMISSC